MAKKKELQVDSSILQFTPKGAFYENADEQFKKVMETWKYLFEFDRVMFALLTLLNGTGFSKGAMNHILLSNSQNLNEKALVPYGLSFDFESKIITYNLNKEKTPRALKNLLMLTGAEGFTKVNNSRTRKIIFDYIFDRPLDEAEGLFLNYKGKLKTLLRHAFGKHDLYNILQGNEKTFVKCVGRQYKNYFPFVLYLFNANTSKILSGKSHVRFSRIEKYLALRDAAQKGDVAKFEKLMDKMPYRTVLGFRNTYKLPIQLKTVVEETKMSSREALQKESAAKRVGAKIKVDYKNQDIYDLMKVLYHKAITGDSENFSEIVDIIQEKSMNLAKMDIGPCVLIMDTSRSMEGSELRPLHPLLTSLCINLSIENVKDVYFTGGKIIKTKLDDGNEIPLVVPDGQTDIWKAFVKAVKDGHKNIIVISDGYENSIKGMFEHTYNYFKDAGYEINLIHINPVFAADAKVGASRNLVSDIKALPVSDYKYLETELLFTQMLTNREMVKKMLAAKYHKLLEGKKQ